MCAYERLKDPNFAGKGHHVFDSFVGLSAPTDEDIQKEIDNPYMTKLLKRPEKEKPRQKNFLERTKKPSLNFQIYNIT